jgi:hypothetical protein
MRAIIRCEISNNKTHIKTQKIVDGSVNNCKMINNFSEC